jgi:hypothetical protein
MTGFWLGPLIAPIIPSLGLPHFLRPLLGGVFVGILISIAVSLFSQIIFRKTEDQGFGVIRLFYGFTGAGLGLAYGLFVLALAAWGVRFFGSFAEGLVTGANAARTNPKKQPAVEPAPLVLINKALETSPAGTFLGMVDPLPPDMYPRLHKIGQIFTDQQAKERFLADPSVAAFSKSAKILSLKSDPELQEALHAGDVWAVLRNPKVQLAAADAQLLTALRTIDLDKALDHALATPVSGGPPQSPPSAKPAPPRSGTGRAKP